MEERKGKGREGMEKGGGAGERKRMRESELHNRVTILRELLNFYLWAVKKK